MTLAAAVLSISLFGLLLSLLRVVPTTQLIVSKTRDALVVMRAADVDDEVKERRIQEASLTLFGLFLSITVRAAAALAAPAVLILSLDYAGVVQSGDVYHTLMSWPVVAATVVCMSGVCWLRWR